MMRCACGNVLDASKTTRMTIGPCRCEKPGTDKRMVRGPSTLPDGPFGVSRQQYEERRRLGLPPITEIERSLHKEMK